VTDRRLRLLAILARPCLCIAQRDHALLMLAMLDHTLSSRRGRAVPSGQLAPPAVPPSFLAAGGASFS